MNQKTKTKTILHFAPRLVYMLLGFGHPGPFPRYSLSMDLRGVQLLMGESKDLARNNGEGNPDQDLTSALVWEVLEDVKPQYGT
jgi:hypothetical protein